MAGHPRSLPRPMLATTGPLPRAGEAADWAFEMKWDGMRAVAEAGPGGWRLTSRSGRDVTAYMSEAQAEGVARFSSRDSPRWARTSSGEAYCDAWGML